MLAEATPLHLATVAGHTDVMQTLVDSGANPETRNYKGNVDIADIIVSNTIYSRKTYKRVRVKLIENIKMWICSFDLKSHQRKTTILL